MCHTQIEHISTAACLRFGDVDNSGESGRVKLYRILLIIRPPLLRSKVTWEGCIVSAHPLPRMVPCTICSDNNSRDAPDASGRLASFSGEGRGSWALSQSSWRVHRCCGRSAFCDRHFNTVDSHVALKMSATCLAASRFTIHLAGWADTTSCYKKYVLSAHPR